MAAVSAQNLVTVGLIARIGCWAVAAFGALTGLGQAAWLLMYAARVDMIALLGLVGLASLLFIVSFVISTIPVLIWVWRAHNNLKREGVSGLKFSPGWAVGSYFVPIMNLFVPFQAMRALYNRSHGEPEELTEATADSVSSWWGCHIGALIFFAVVAITTAIDAIPGVWMTTPFWANAGLTVLYALLTAGSAFFLQKTIARITQAQLHGVGVAATFE